MITPLSDSAIKHFAIPRRDKCQGVNVRDSLVPLRENLPLFNGYPESDG